MSTQRVTGLLASLNLSLRETAVWFIFLSFMNNEGKNVILMIKFKVIWKCISIKRSAQFIDVTKKHFSRFYRKCRKFISKLKMGCLMLWEHHLVDHWVYKGRLFVALTRINLPFAFFLMLRMYQDIKCTTWSSSIITKPFQSLDCIWSIFTHSTKEMVW